jgi:hypothetical protein
MQKILLKVKKCGNNWKEKKKLNFSETLMIKKANMADKENLFLFIEPSTLKNFNNFNNFKKL